MLAIRMQRTGRKGHAMFRVVVQESRLTPTSGRVVAQLGSYDPHNKTVTLAKDKAEFYLKNGAQPSDRVAKLLESEGIKLPEWYKKPATASRSTKNPDKLRKNQPAAEPEAPATETTEPVEEASETPVEEPAEAGTEA
jgi:small subunit ribosomal protein S16